MVVLLNSHPLFFQSTLKQKVEDTELSKTDLLNKIKSLECGKAELLARMKEENSHIFQRYDSTIEGYRKQLSTIKVSHTEVNNYIKGHTDKMLY